VGDIRPIKFWVVNILDGCVYSNGMFILIHIKSKMDWRKMTVVSCRRKPAWIFNLGERGRAGEAAPPVPKRA
jgi:hypothetical protein